MTVRQIKLAAVLLLACASPFALAASATSEIDATYRAERAACMDGSSNQDRTTCLKEASAARAEAKRGLLETNRGSKRDNATQRCDALPGDQRDACMMRMQGAGSVSGSVRDGGMIRELTVPDRK